MRMAYIMRYIQRRITLPTKSRRAKVRHSWFLNLTFGQERSPYKIYDDMNCGVFRNEPRSDINWLGGIMPFYKFGQDKPLLIYGVPFRCFSIVL